MEKADLGAKNTSAILEAYSAGVFGKGTVLRELKQLSNVSGMWTNITDKMIEDADKEDEERAKQEAEEQEELQLGVNKAIEEEQPNEQKGSQKDPDDARPNE